MVCIRISCRRNSQFIQNEKSAKTKQQFNKYKLLYFMNPFVCENSQTQPNKSSLRKKICGRQNDEDFQAVSFLFE